VARRASFGRTPEKLVSKAKDQFWEETARFYEIYATSQFCRYEIEEIETLIRDFRSLVPTSQDSQNRHQSVNLDYSDGPLSAEYKAVRAAMIGFGGFVLYLIYQSKRQREVLGRHRRDAGQYER
jgi:hypothetical protein